ncbi:MAG: D-alanine--D-alanine ligase [Planctomycetes bacterium]|nr:D-alanine--D-alanine ligase [Planctomycetota bacterium]
MDIGIAFDLKSDFTAAPGAPDDRLEEYDSERTIAAIEAALSRRGHRARRMGGGKRFLAALLAEPPELVFNVAEGAGSRSREAHVPAACEMVGVPCTHSDPLTLALALDKALAKSVVAAAGVAVARGAVVSRVEQLAALDLPFPCIAKPLFEGSSMGVRKGSKSGDGEQLRRDVLRLLTGYEQPALVEEFLTGPEFTVGILGSGESARVLATMEIHPRGGATADFVYSVEVKRVWDEQVEYHVPPRRPPALVAAIEAVALASYRALQCRDVGRVDVRLGADGRPRFIELNPLPGINPGWSDLCVLAERVGVDHDALVGRILEQALARLARS